MTLAVLRVLATPEPPHGLADIAKRAEVTKTTGHRMPQTLVRNNHAQTGEGAYAPDAALLALGMQIGLHRTFDLSAMLGYRSAVDA